MLVNALKNITTGEFVLESKSSGKKLFIKFEPTTNGRYLLVKNKEGYTRVAAVSNTQNWVGLCCINELRETKAALKKVWDLLKEGKLAEYVTLEKEE